MVWLNYMVLEIENYKIVRLNYEIMLLKFKEFNVYFFFENYMFYYVGGVRLGVGRLKV